MGRFSSALALVFFLSMPLVGWAAADAPASVDLRLERTEASLGESVRLLISVSGARQSESEPLVHGLDDFTVVRGGSSSRLEIINGRVNAGIDYTFFLRPRKTGVFRIGPAEVTVKGKSLESGTQDLKVTAVPRASGTERGAVFLTAAISAEEVFVEEQAVYTLKLYHRTPVSDLSLVLPEVERLAFKQLGQPLQYQGVYDGKPYQVVEVRYALLPAEPGRYTLAPARMDLQVPDSRGRSSRGFFDAPFFKDPFFSFSRGRPLSVVSETLALEVRPLPEEGRPVDFSGLVGDFKVTSKLKPSIVKAGESATLTVVVEGHGNVNRIPDLEVPDLEGLKIYADRPTLEVTEDTGGSKTMKWALVPEKEGPYRIPALSLSYFDTRERRYRWAKTPEHLLDVLPGETVAAEAAPAPAAGEGSERAVKQEVRQIGRDILPVHGSAEDFMAGSSRPQRSELLWLVLLIPPLAYAGALTALGLRRKSVRTLAATRARRAAQVCLRRCRREALSPEELIQCVRDYLNDRFGLSLGTLTSDEAAGILVSRGVGADRARELGRLLRGLEDRVYAGGASGTGGEERALPGMIRRIERELR